MPRRGATFVGFPINERERERENSRGLAGNQITSDGCFERSRVQMILIIRSRQRSLDENKLKSHQRTFRSSPIPTKEHTKRLEQQIRFCADRDATRRARPRGSRFILARTRVLCLALSRKTLSSKFSIAREASERFVAPPSKRVRTHADHLSSRMRATRMLRCAIRVDRPGAGRKSIYARATSACRRARDAGDK